MVTMTQITFVERLDAGKQVELFGAVFRAIGFGEHPVARFGWAPSHIVCVLEHKEMVMQVLDDLGIEYVTRERRPSRSIRPKGATRKTLLSSNYGRCYLCNENPSFTLHHIIPLKDGGTHYWENLAPLCVRCHDFIHRYEKEWEGYDGFPGWKEQFASLLQRNCTLGPHTLPKMWRSIRNRKDTFEE